MKKNLTTFIMVAAALVCLLSSCNKNNSEIPDHKLNAFLPGSEWVDDEGNTLSFTKTTISFKGSSASYTIDVGTEDAATFAVDDLKAGDKTYVSGVASNVQKSLYLKEYGGVGQTHFIKKK